MRYSKDQKGSMMIEVVAVVALLALLTPLLFRQIQRRTDEVDNVRIASVMREAKDILQRAIEDNVDGLIEANFAAGENVCLNKSTWPKSYTGGRELKDYAGVGGFPRGVDFYVCRHLVNNKADRPVFFGVVVDSEDGFAQSFLPAADIATMIGAEGGVCTASTVATGVRQGWKLEGFNNFGCDASENEVVALTSLVGSSSVGTIDAVSLADFITEEGSVRAAFAYADDMHAEGFTAGSSTSRPCITDPFNNTGERTDNDADHCVPVFEVVPYEDPANPGEVYIRNAKLVFNPETTDTYADPNNTSALPPTRPKSNVLVDTTRAAAEKTEGSQVEYAIDPTGESVMQDIRLISRGNAKLSELLPNYILKGVVPSISNGDSHQNPDNQPFDGWTCPPYHKKAIILEGCSGGQWSISGYGFICMGGATDQDRAFRIYKYCVFKNE